MHTKYHLMILGILLFLPTAVYCQTEVAGHSPEKALEYGEKMYRDGILPSGKPMKALVMGDIPMDGRMFTCDDCHQRSGLGSEEGTIITWPTNGKELYQPRRITGAYKPPQRNDIAPTERRPLPKYYQMAPARPAYTDETLARVLRSGIDPAGRKLNPVMPKYRFNKDNMAIMVHYLKNLSREISPGVDATTIHFATVITDEVPEKKKMAMLSVLQAHIDAHNSQSRHEEKRAQAGPFYKSERHKAYRRLSLHIWTLTGPSSSWPTQLENYYAEQPVFGFLGGITDGSWSPIHRFCEKNEIPSIFPITDLPEISDSDWSTLYFSKGLFQEGESVAKFVRNRYKNEEPITVIQLYDSKNPRSEALVQGFQQTWARLDKRRVETLAFSEFRDAQIEKRQALFDTSAPVILLSWLGTKNLQTIESLMEPSRKPDLIIASSTLLNKDFSSIPEDLKQLLVLTYPESLPQHDVQSRFAVKRWLKARKIDEEYFEIKAKMYFLGWMLPGALKGMRSEFFRDYFLEGFDMMIDQDYAIATFPRLTFGNGQRYASKGCYLVKLPGDSESDLIPVSDWVIY